MELETDTPHIMADHGIIPAETLDPIEATRATEGQFGHPADTRQLRTSNEPAASALSRIPNATGQGQDSGELAGLAMGGLIEREAAAQIAERDCDWSAFGKSGIPEWDGGPDGIRDYRLGIRVGRAIAAAIRALPAAHDGAHPDDLAVDQFAAAMKAKLARKRVEGRGGWDGPDCDAEILSCLLRDHVEKGDPVDVGNLAMMLHQRGERIAAAAQGGAEVERLRAQLSEMSAQYTRACQIVDKTCAERGALKAEVERLRDLVGKNTDASLRVAEDKDAEIERLHSVVARMMDAAQERADRLTSEEDLSEWATGANLVVDDLRPVADEADAHAEQKGDAA